MIPDNLPDFASWKPENLVNFAREASTEMLKQNEIIRQLKDDLRVIIDNYRREIQRARKAD
jgi:hypothetical protein